MSKQFQLDEEIRKTIVRVRMEHLGTPWMRNIKHITLNVIQSTFGLTRESAGAYYEKAWSNSPQG